MKLLLIALTFINIAWAEPRFNENQKEAIFAQVKQIVTVNKKENNDKLNVKSLQPMLSDFIGSLAQNQIISDQEKEKISNGILTFTAGLNPDSKEEVINKYFADRINEINREKLPERSVCNPSLPCASGLTCAMISNQNVIGQKCKAFNKECTNDNDCCSSACNLNPVSKKKTCGPISLCFKPLAKGMSCLDNPVCAVGTCSKYDSKTIGIGECTSIGKKCQNNNECCSNSCKSNQCSVNKICKDCTEDGDYINGKECCEGLYPDENNNCKGMPPLVPNPFVLDQGLLKFLKDVIIGFGNLIVSPSYADNTLIADEFKEDGDVKLGTITHKKTSDFKTCEIDFKTDYYKSLQTDGLLNLELALLAFDYVHTGEANYDYWQVHRLRPKTSIDERLRKIAKKHQAERAKSNLQFKEYDKKVTCACLDLMGYPNIKIPAKKLFFETQCPVEYDRVRASAAAAGVATANTATITAGDGADDVAGGLKGKKMIVDFTKMLADYNVDMANKNSSIHGEILKIQTWSDTNSSEWTKGTRRDDILWTYSVTKYPGIISFIMRVFSGVAGLFGWGSGGSSPIAVAINATNSSYSAKWIADSLAGAWQADPPRYNDVITRSRRCGRFGIAKCEDHTVYLNTPINRICSSETYASGCINNFMALYDNPTNQDGIPQYVIDPWIPAGVSKDLLVKTIYQGKNYVESLKNSYQRGKTAANIGGDKEPSMSPGTLASFGLIFDNYGNKSEDFLITPAVIAEIKKQAKLFAIQEEVYSADEVDNLNNFSDYAYEYHFINPKLSTEGEISYPLINFDAYLEFMANAAANRTVGAATVAETVTDLAKKHLNDYVETLKLYATKGGYELKAITNNNNQEKKIPGMKNINAEIAEAELALSQLNSFSNLIDSAKLGNLGNDRPGLNGNSNGAKLTAAQSEFLNAIGKLRAARNDQLRKLAHYKKMTANNPSRANQVENALKKYGANFSTGNNGSSSKGSFGFGQAGSLGQGQAGSQAAAADSTASSEQAAGAGFNSAQDGNMQSFTADGNSFHAPENKMGQSENNQKAVNPVDVQNEIGKEDYKSIDGSSLFKIISSAYMRNYDKLLEKKENK